MTQRNINRLEMFQAVKAYLDAHGATWNSTVAASRYKNQLDTTIDALKAAAGRQLQAQVFIGTSTQALKRSIAKEMDILDDALESFAEDTDNADLLTQAKNSLSDYFLLPNEDFETKVKEVIKLLEANLEALRDYGVTAAQIEKVKTSFNRFAEQRGRPRQYQISSSKATRDIATLVKAGSAALAKLDKVLKRFKLSDATFYNGYVGARKIIGD